MGGWQLFLCCHFSQIIINMIETDTRIACQIEFIENGSKEMFFLVLLGNIPLQEIERRIIFFLKRFLYQLINLAGNFFFVRIDFFKNLFQAGIFGFWRGNRA